MVILIAIVIVFIAGVYFASKTEEIIIAFATAILVTALIFSPIFISFYCVTGEKVVISQNTVTYELVPFDITAYFENDENFFTEGSCNVLMCGENYIFCHEIEQNGSIERVFETVSLEDISIHETDGNSPTIVKTTTVIRSVKNTLGKILLFPFEESGDESIIHYDIYVPRPQQPLSILESSS